MEHLTNESFKEKVFDYEAKKEWKFIGERPCIIDFYADWCGPCRMLSPVVEEISKEYKGLVDVYKVNTETEQELSQIFGISSIPTVLFIPVSGTPVVSTGYMPKLSFQKSIADIFKIKK